MAPGGIEDHGTEGNHQDVPGIHGHMTEDADPDQRRRQEGPGSAADKAPQAGTDEPGVLGYAETQHRDQDDA